VVAGTSVTIPVTSAAPGSTTYVLVYNKYSGAPLGTYNDGGSGTISFTATAGYWMALPYSVLLGLASYPGDPAEFEIEGTLPDRTGQYRVVGFRENPADPMMRVLILEKVETPIRP
jgi:hypothetical protein